MKYNIINDITHHVTSTVPMPILRSLLVLIVAFFAGSFIKRFLHLYVKPKTHSPQLIELLGNTVRNLFMLFATLSCLSNFGIDVHAMITGLGVTGFAIGFALKDTLANIIAGIFILLYRPFKIGQYIKVATSKTITDEGYVKSIDLRYTKVETQELKTLIPNSILFTTSIVIFKKPPE